MPLGKLSVLDRNSRIQSVLEKEAPHRLTTPTDSHSKVRQRTNLVSTISSQVEVHFDIKYNADSSSIIVQEIATKAQPKAKKSVGEV